MRIYKFSVFLIFATSVALLYVHQQVQLIKISYQIESNEKEIATLLDQNKSMMYNITRLKSPVHLNNKFLASSKEFTIPERWKVIEVAAAPKIDNGATIKLAKAKGRFPIEILKRLGGQKEAFANTVK